MTPREIVGARIAEVLVEMLEQAFKDSGNWPLNARGRAVVEEMRRQITRTAGGIPDDGIARLVGAPAEEMKNFIRSQIEPDFRRSIAKDLLS